MAVPRRSANKARSKRRLRLRLSVRWPPGSSPKRWPAAPGFRRDRAIGPLGDPDAAEVLRWNAQAVAYACTILAEVFGVEMIVLGSSARHFGPEWVRQVQDLFAKELLEISASLLRIVPAALGETLQDRSPLAAAVLGMRKE